MGLTDAERARVAEIKALHAAATPGTWYAVDKGNTVPSHAVMRYATGEKAVNIASGISPKTGNAEFIVNAHGAIPWLLSIIDRLSEQPVTDSGVVAAAIKHFEALQKRYTKQHNGMACEHVKMALIALNRLSEQPEVVRCDECRFESDCTKHVVPEGTWEQRVDFCSYGQRAGEVERG